MRPPDLEWECKQLAYSTFENITNGGIVTALISFAYAYAKADPLTQYRVSAVAKSADTVADMAVYGLAIRGSGILEPSPSSSGNVWVYRVQGGVSVKTNVERIEFTKNGSQESNTKHSILVSRVRYPVG